MDHRNGLVRDAQELRTTAAELRRNARRQAEGRRLRADSDAIERRITREHNAALLRIGG